MGQPNESVSDESNEAKKKRGLFPIGGVGKPDPDPKPA